MNGRNGGNAKEIGARLNMIGSMTGKSRPDFKAVALLSTVHRSFGRSAFLASGAIHEFMICDVLRHLTPAIARKVSVVMSLD